MRLPIVAALALTASSSLFAQTTFDFSNATPVAGDWHYESTATGSESTFNSTAGYPQIWIDCVRATRHVTIARPASVAAPTVNVWTSSATRSVPASFNPATRRLTIDLATYDPLLDAIATSRGRMAFTIGTDPALVVPAWAEVARVIEDCRA